MSFKKIGLSLTVLALLSGCMEGNKQGMGTVLGGITGAALGSTIGKGSGQMLAIAAGAIGGAFLGNSIGANMDKTDRMAYENHAQRSFENGRDGQALPWHSRHSDNSGRIFIKKTYHERHHHGDRYCREYVQTINVGGQSQKAYGKACRQPDGHWQIQQSED